MDMRHVSNSTAKLAAFVTLAAAAAAGCGGGHHQVRSAAAVESDAPSAAPGLHANQIPTKIDNQPGVRKNVVQTKCAAIPGGWAAEGTATNTRKTPVEYKILVHFTTTKATVLDYAQTTVPVAPGKTVKWQAQKQFKADKKMLCPMPGIALVR